MRIFGIEITTARRVDALEAEIRGLKISHERTTQRLHDAVVGQKAYSIDAIYDHLRGNDAVPHFWRRCDDAVEPDGDSPSDTEPLYEKPGVWPERS